MYNSIVLFSFVLFSAHEFKIRRLMPLLPPTKLCTACMYRDCSACFATSPDWYKKNCQYDNYCHKQTNSDQDFFLQINDKKKRKKKRNEEKKTRKNNIMTNIKLYENFKSKQQRKDKSIKEESEKENRETICIVSDSDYLAATFNTHKHVS